MRNIDPSLIALLNEVRKTYEAIPERFRKEATPAVLTRVIARLVPGVTAVDGSTRDADLHTWLQPHSHLGFIIDVIPTLIFPGPVLIKSPPALPYTTTFEGLYTVNATLTSDNDKRYQDKVAEIVDATEGARRFLSMP